MLSRLFYWFIGNEDLRLWGRRQAGMSFAP
jgi:hypothetical protein